MAFDPTIAAIRFGSGLHPQLPAPKSAGAMLKLLRGPDVMAKAFPIPVYGDLMPEAHRLRELARARKKLGKRTPKMEAEVKLIRANDRERNAMMLRHLIARNLDTEDGFRERLLRFWADHFTVKGRGGITRNNVGTYVEDALRGRITGRFGDMLKAVVTHPMMLVFLDQPRSVGPNSFIAGRTPRRGLNENLAREVLELHTLGVGGRYTQKDVRELAEVFAGMSQNIDKGFNYMTRGGEPGAEVVLGRSYGGEDPKVEDIYAVLHDLALHPDTARHVSRKLVVHFVSDTPDAGMVEEMAAEWQRTDGDLMAVYSVMLNHPAAFAGPLTKAKQPIDFVCSALRALGVPGAEVAALNLGRTRRNLAGPMILMGQHWEHPVGPDGWPEDEAHWITPQGLAARISWAMRLASDQRKTLPDPRDFVGQALGDLASEPVHFAAKAAETRMEGIGVILSSPDFQKR
ncbi:DUF1800 domain-containing protein [Alphaproteobacteria bacterium KMM 3653]|uniref:DUF1800 domain-containing protein n=1 Tax=Harenicola maris TaxID=2841044 RepID=A0AAP2CS16_9RHOB|nr:DUF1800 domain-containing protein [Harenicola maris]